jgi:hypothetical protein
VLAASIVLGKLSGRKAVSTRLEQLGFGLNAEEVNDVFKRFKVRHGARLKQICVCVACRVYQGAAREPLCYGSWIDGSCCS